jgi:glycosyltransferase involved in cell wall biosynthesis
MSKHLIFFHQTYPAQFGPVLQFLRDNYDVRLSFFSESVSKEILSGVTYIPYKRDEMHRPEQPYFFTRHFEEECRSMYGVYLAMEAAKVPDPDVFIGHVGFGNLMLLHTAYRHVPTVGFFEIFYNPFQPETYTRPEFPVPKENIMRMPLRNATQLIELEYCTRGYSPTPYQRSTYPAAYQHKLETIFDGVDTHFYHPGEVTSASELVRTWPSDVKIITYAARGLEAFRGFDVFMEATHRLSQKRNDVHFIVAGRPQTHYGPEAIHLKDKTFKEFVMERHEYDLSRYHFLDWISEPALLDLFRLSALQMYWTIPFTLSWSFFQSLASGALVMASDVASVRDVMVDNVNGLLVDPYDIDAIMDRMMDVLDNPAKYAPLRDAARQTIVENYSLEVCLPRLSEFYLKTVSTPQQEEALSKSRSVF